MKVVRPRPCKGDCEPRGFLWLQLLRAVEDVQPRRLSEFNHTGHWNFDKILSINNANGRNERVCVAACDCCESEAPKHN